MWRSQQVWRSRQETVREFERLLRAALAIDVSKRPSIRLANLIAQKRARYLLTQIGSLVLIGC